MRKRKLRLEELLAALESQLQPYWTIQKKVFDDIEQNKKNVSDALVWNRLWELTKRGLVAHHYNPHRFMLTEKGLEEKIKLLPPTSALPDRTLPTCITRFCTDPHVPI